MILCKTRKTVKVHVGSLFTVLEPETAIRFARILQRLVLKRGDLIGLRHGPINCETYVSLDIWTNDIEVMQTPTSFAFLDESGGSSIDVPLNGGSSHYVLTAILVKGVEVDAARDLAEEVRRKHFQAGEMASSGIGSDDEHRLRVLADLNNLPCAYYVFVVDKRKIWKDSGLIFKKPFLKFLSRKVYERLLRTFQHVRIVADEQGNRQFMGEFEEYVKKHHEPTLFENPEFSFSTRPGEPLIQVADFVAGSVRRMFDAKHEAPQPERILEAIRAKLVVLEEWPPGYHDLSERVSAAVATNHDAMVREYCNLCVGKYLQSLNGESEEEQIREAVLTYLAHESRCSQRARYISAPEIEAHLLAMGFRALGHYELRSKIIAHFRDHGVIVASNASGYRIPTELSDIANYVDRCQTVIGPMLTRLQNARESIRMMSHNKLDILDAPEFAALKSIFDRGAPGLRDI